MTPTPRRAAAARLPKRLPARKAAVLAARALDAMKAEKVVVLDVAEVSPIAEIFLIASGDNPRHVRALAQEAVRALSAEGIRPHSTDGLEQGIWAVLDYGPLVVHVFRPESREFYDLEMLWGDGKRVRWQAPKAKAAKA